MKGTTDLSDVIVTIKSNLKECTANLKKDEEEKVIIESKMIALQKEIDELEHSLAKKL